MIYLYHILLSFGYISDLFHSLLYMFILNSCLFNSVIWYFYRFKWLIFYIFIHFISIFLIMNLSSIIKSLFFYLIHFFNYWMISFFIIDLYFSFIFRQVIFLIDHFLLWVWYFCYANQKINFFIFIVFWILKFYHFCFFKIVPSSCFVIFIHNQELK